jgi:hypothetical protein
MRIRTLTWDQWSKSELNLMAVPLAVSSSTRSGCGARHLCGSSNRQAFGASSPLEEIRSKCPTSHLSFTRR